MKSKALGLKFLDWLLSIICYSVVLVIVSKLCKSFYIDLSNYYIYVLISSIVIFILNKTIKPILVSITIPLTALTLGLFYPITNLIVLKLTDLILTTHFELNNIILAFFIAILISIFNFIMDEIIIKPITKRRKRL